MLFVQYAYCCFNFCLYVFWKEKVRAKGLTVIFNKDQDEKTTGGKADSP